VAQVFGCAKAAGKDYSVVFLSGCRGDILDLPAGDARRFDEDIACLLHWLLSYVVDDMRLVLIGCKALELSASAVEREKGQDGLLHSRTLVDAAAAENHRYASHVQPPLLSDGLHMSGSDVPFDECRRANSCTASSCSEVSMEPGRNLRIRRTASPA